MENKALQKLEDILIYLKHYQNNEIHLNFEIYLIRSKNLTARLIQFGMFLWAILRLRKPIKTHNHCQIYIESDVTRNVTSGALADGIVTEFFNDYFTKNISEILHIKKYQIDCEDSNKLIRAIEYLIESNNKPYEYANFFYHAIKIFTGKWRGETNNKKLYCYEHGINLINILTDHNINPYLNPYQAEKLFDLLLKK